MKFDIPRRKISLVIVDDSQELIRVYRKFLAKANVEVTADFSSTKDMLSYFNDNPGADSIVLMDYKVSGMNGSEAAEQLKKLKPGQKIILATSEDLFRFKDVESIFDDVIQKPFTISELIATIERVTSPIRIKGSRIFSDPVEVENLLKAITSDCAEKLCSVRNPSSIKNGPHLKAHTSSYVTAISKGLKVFLVTEITQENLAYCKQLMLKRGVQLRHLEGVTSNFAVWDEKHVAETVEKSSDVSPYGHVLYSNLKSDITRILYLFEYFWNRAKPAEARIRELEATPDLSKVTLVSGYEALFKTRHEMTLEAEVSLDICAVSELVSKVIITNLFEDHADSVARGVRNRYLFDISSKEDVVSAKRLLEIGVEVRHLEDSIIAFGVSEKASISMMTVKDTGANEETRGIFSVHRDYVEQYKAIFEILWNGALPAAARIKKIEEEEKVKELRNN